MTRSRSKSGGWQDHYTRRAQREKFPARSVYKLKEIQKKYRLIRPGDRVLDLGCAPGAWLKFAAQVVGDQGRVVGIDLKPTEIDLPGHAVTMVGDAQALAAGLDEQLGRGYHVVLSDMAPSTTGNRHVDAARSLGLCETALYVAGERLVSGGHFVCKIFQGGDVNAFTQTVRAVFKTTKLFKPQSSRKASKEIFIIGLGKR